jgi:predicted metal-dependent enzyme (double-stranded beta helix superfamily)
VNGVALPSLGDGPRPDAPSALAEQPQRDPRPDSRSRGLAATPRPRGRDLSAVELEAFVRELADRPELWIDFVRHDASQRVYEELLSDAHLTAWLICWMDDQDTGFHDHDVSAGAVAVVSGRVREERLAIGGQRSQIGQRLRELTAGQAFHFSPSDIHRVSHSGGDPAVTLHVYSPPLARMGAYTIADDGVLQRRAMPSSQELRPQERDDGALATRRDAA